MSEQKPCKLCGIELYLKLKQYAKPLLAPLTPAQELREKLLDMTGEAYIPTEYHYCPFCGRALRGDIK